MLTNDDLYGKSIGLILENQAANGAFIASPNFPTYHYCWFRDSTYISYALDLAGEHQSARRFYDWAAQMITEHSDQIQQVLAIPQGQIPPANLLLHTRYTLDGKTGNDDWPNFQLDGFGTLLWGIEQHVSLSNFALPEQWRDAVALLSSYLQHLWMLPCYDCWEEFGDKIHTATLAALYGGLRSAANLLGADGANSASAAAAIQQFVRNNLVENGALCKFIGNTAVDSSLVHVATPYRLLEPDDPIMVATIARIDTELRQGGVHRYAEDSYYGGGEWILLSAYLGWYYTEVGNFEQANELMRWIKSKADAQGELPEQVHEHLNYPAKLPEWEQLWGPVAKPLLWSQAAYITLGYMVNKPENAKQPIGSF